MTKKEESLLNLAPLAKLPTGTTNGHLTPIGPSHELTKTEQRVVQEWHKQELVINLTANKGILAEDRVADLHIHAVSSFFQASGQILDLKADAQGKEHQAYVEEFSKYILQLLGQNLAGVVSVASANMGQVVHDTLNFMTEEERRSFMQRLLGR